MILRKKILICLVLLIFCVRCADDKDASIDRRSSGTLKSKSEMYMDNNCPVSSDIFPEGHECSSGIPDYFESNDECHLDSDCTARENGFCTSMNDGYCRCYYHNCIKDSDCSEGEACACEKFYRIRFCTPSCRSHLDCPGNHKCVIAGVFFSCRYYRNFEQVGSRGFRCTSDEDQCNSHDDCEQDYYCVFSEENGHFACVYSNYWKNINYACPLANQLTILPSKKKTKAALD